ncbi:MAG: hypothetical protein OEV40_04305 [Acidimicrobiia bacterium]|nr:hypothetical protein [Acidimicrobiia bacterium]
MPASQVHTDNESDGAVDDVVEGPRPTVHDHLEMALEAAAEQQMATSELMGIFFYYAHSIAESYRQDVLKEQQSPG